jgi:hypothetical protein
MHTKFQVQTQLNWKEQISQIMKKEGKNDKIMCAILQCTPTRLRQRHGVSECDWKTEEEQGQLEWWRHQGLTPY